MLNMVLLFIGTTEIIVIGGIALLLFGGKKLPELMRGLGKGVREFKDGMSEVREEITDPFLHVPSSVSKPQPLTCCLLPAKATSAYTIGSNDYSHGWGMISIFPRLKWT